MILSDVFLKGQALQGILCVYVISRDKDGTFLSGDLLKVFWPLSRGVATLNIAHVSCKHRVLAKLLYTYIGLDAFVPISSSVPPSIMKVTSGIVFVRTLPIRRGQ